MAKEIVVSAYAKKANVAGDRYAPVIKIGEWEFIFNLEYQEEADATRKAEYILSSDILNMQTGLNQRQGRWVK